MWIVNKISSEYITQFHFPDCALRAGYDASQFRSKRVYFATCTFKIVFRRVTCVQLILYFHFCINIFLQFKLKIIQDFIYSVLKYGYVIVSAISVSAVYSLISFQLLNGF